MTTLTLQPDQIISASDVTRRYKEVREKTLEKGASVIFNHNKPELVILTMERFNLLEEAMEILEYQNIYKRLQEVKSGGFYTAEEAKAKTDLNF